MTAQHSITPESALNALLERVAVVPTERLPLDDSAGRVLARPVTADRDHPPCDMSAMDGYALRTDDLPRGALRVANQSARIGHPSVRCDDGEAVYIVTGAPLPTGADTVVRIEDVIVENGAMRVKEAARVVRGGNIRRRGENLAVGSVAIDAGVAITPPVIATAAAFGAGTLEVYRRLRVGVVVTGDELLHAGEVPASHQIRDSSGHGLNAMIRALPWTECVSVTRVPDHLERIESALRDAIERCDAVILTGGVSMGERDFVPEAVRRAGADVCFHRLPIRPGKPVLGAVTRDGKPVLGLPGNPVSTLVTARRFAVPALTRRAGLRLAPPPTVESARDVPVDASLWHYRQVRVCEDGRVECCASVSSGDITAAGRSDGFIEVPPVHVGPNRFKFFAW